MRASNPMFSVTMCDIIAHGVIVFTVLAVLLIASATELSTDSAPNRYAL